MTVLSSHDLENELVPPQPLGTSSSSTSPVGVEKKSSSQPIGSSSTTSPSGVEQKSPPQTLGTSSSSHTNGGVGEKNSSSQPIGSSSTTSPSGVGEKKSSPQTLGTSSSSHTNGGGVTELDDISPDFGNGREAEEATYNHQPSSASPTNHQPSCAPERPPCMWVKASTFSKLLFIWTNKILGLKGDVSEVNLPLLHESEECAHLLARYESAWEKERKKSRPSAMFALLRCFILDYCLVGWTQVLEMALLMGQAFTLSKFMEELKNSKTDSLAPVILLAIIFSIETLFAVIIHAYFFTWIYWTGMRVRHAAQALVFKKCLGLSLNVMGHFGQGKITNLYSSELWRIEMGAVQFVFIILAPMHLIVVVIVVYFIVGMSAIYGVLVLAIFAAAQFLFQKLFRRFRKQTVGFADTRVGLMKELLEAARMIKMYSWEEPFAKNCAKVRNKETKCLSQAFTLRSVNYSGSFTAAITAVGVAFIAEAASGVKLEGHRLFPLIALFNHLQLTLSIFFPFAFEMISDLIVADTRLTRLFMDADKSETKLAEIMKSVKTSNPNESSIECNNVSFDWGNGGVQLKDISFTVGNSALTVITGKVGCGKTTLALNLLGEITGHVGSITLKANGIAYVEQEPFILQGTIIHNICSSVADKEYDFKALLRVVEASGLAADINILPEGIFTEIGERGVNLSGGQKARLSLARALYSDAEVYILDDPFSALDPNVQKSVFEKTILTFLKDKTVLLITHQVHLLSLCVNRENTRVIVMEEGQIVKQGLVHEFVEFFSLDNGSPKNGVTTPKMSNTVEDSTSIRTDEQAGSALQMQLALSPKGGENKGQAFISTEGQGSKYVHFSVWKKYWMAAASLPVIIFFLFWIVFAQAVQVLTISYFTIWTSMDYGDQQQEKWIHYMIILVTCTWLSVLFRSLGCFQLTLRASKRIHNLAFEKVMLTGIRFFELNPLGRILNRFSKDIGLMDDILPINYNDTINCMMAVLGIVVFVCTVNPFVLPILLPLLLYFLWIRTYYLKSSQPLKQLDATTRSPIFIHLTTMLQGLPSLRAYGLQKVVLEDYLQAMDLNFAALETFKFCERWFGIRMDLVACAFQTCAIAVVVIVWVAASNLTTEDIDLIGISLIYMIQIAGLFQWAVRQSAEVQNIMTSVERVLEYGDLEYEERPVKSRGSCISSICSSEKKRMRESTVTLRGDIMVNDDDDNVLFGSQGDLLFEDVELRYNPNAPLVLNKVTFHLTPGQSCGVVGRTGAGKSSLLTALFKLTPCENGRILIDGVDISTVPLKTLRNSIAIIPQSPTIFTGTVAFNLDPFNDYTQSESSKEKLWTVLKQVQLYDAINRLPRKLDSQLSEGENALSVGERQCLCLARALLRRNKLFALDEATANVDLETDQLIQTTIRNESSESTVLTIAHRVETIINSDRILVMDYGRVAQFGPPEVLLEEEDGIFASLASRFRSDNSPTSVFRRPNREENGRV